MKDRHGNAVTGATGAAIEYFDASVEAFGIYRGDPLALLDAAIAEGQWSAAALRLDRHNMSCPHDFFAIQSGTLMDFFRANARDLRDRVARVLPAWSPDMPLYALLCTRSVLRNVVTTTGPRKPAARHSIWTRATAGRITRWRMSWRWEGGPRTELAG
jgi:hypothetical protein